MNAEQRVTSGFNFPEYLAFFPIVRYDIRERGHVRVTGSETETKPRRLRLKTKLILILALAAALLITFFMGAAWSGKDEPPVITSDLLGQQLRSAQELVSVEYYYTNMGKFENQVDFYGWKVPFTTKSFLVSYDGLIKAGVDLTAVQVTVNEGTRTITVTLPESKILSHEIPEDSIEVFDESHNIFNPITISDYTGFTRDQKSVIERKAIDNGLLTGASEKARAAVTSFLSLMPGMEQYTLVVK